MHFKLLRKTFNQILSNRNIKNVNVLLLGKAVGEVWVIHGVVFPDTVQTFGSEVIKKFMLWQKII